MGRCAFAFWLTAALPKMCSEDKRLKNARGAHCNAKCTGSPIVMQRCTPVRLPVRACACVRDFACVRACFPKRLCEIDYLLAHAWGEKAHLLDPLTFN